MSGLRSVHAAGQRPARSCGRGAPPASIWTRGGGARARDQRQGVFFTNEYAWNARIPQQSVFMLPSKATTQIMYYCILYNRAENTSEASVRAVGKLFRRFLFVSRKGQTDGTVLYGKGRCVTLSCSCVSFIFNWFFREGVSKCTFLMYVVSHRVCRHAHFGEKSVWC